MSVLVKGMKMPKKCEECKFWAITPCTATFQNLGEKDCPLIEVPEPHGNLIDRDAFVKELEYDIELAQRALDGMECVGKDREILLLDKICKDNSIQYLSEAPVVIPASKEKET